jgi:hypothetical protein
MTHSAWAGALVLAVGSVLTYASVHGLIPILMSHCIFISSQVAHLRRSKKTMTRNGKALLPEPLGELGHNRSNPIRKISTLGKKGRKYPVRLQDQDIKQGKISCLILLQQQWIQSRTIQQRVPQKASDKRVLNTSQQWI